jgi:hypothetical protein
VAYHSPPRACRYFSALASHVPRNLSAMIVLFPTLYKEHFCPGFLPSWLYRHRWAPMWHTTPRPAPADTSPRWPATWAASCSPTCPPSPSWPPSRAQNGWGQVLKNVKKGVIHDNIYSIQSISDLSDRVQMLKKLWIRNCFCFLNPDPDPIFLWGLDSDPDPTWLAKSFVSSSGSDPKYSLFHNACDLKAFLMAIKATKKILN